MLGRTRRIHFVGIGGIGMSGIAEVLANLGYEVTGSDARGSDVTARLSQLGVQVHIGHDAAHVGSADVVVVSSAIGAANPELVEARRRRDSRDSARGDARRADAAPLRHRDRRRARQDHDDVDGGARARAGGTRSHGGDRWTAQRVRKQRAPGTRRADGGRGRRERPIVPDALAGDRAGDQHRSRAHGRVRQLAGAEGRLPAVHQQGAVLRCGGALCGRRAGARAAAADQPPGHHLRICGRRAPRSSRTSPPRTCGSNRSPRAAR